MAQQGASRARGDEIACWSGTIVAAKDVGSLHGRFDAYVDMHDGGVGGRDDCQRQAVCDSKAICILKLKMDNGKESGQQSLER